MIINQVILIVNIARKQYIDAFIEGNHLFRDPYFIFFPCENKVENALKKSGYKWVTRMTIGR